MMEGYLSEIARDREWIAEFKCREFNALSDEELREKSQEIIERLGLFDFREQKNCSIVREAQSVDQILKKLKWGIELAEISLELERRGY